MKPYIMPDRVFKRAVEWSHKQQSICARKFAFPSRKAARSQLRTMQRSGALIGATLEAYACVFCQCWHLGNRIGAPWEQ